MATLTKCRNGAVHSIALVFFFFMTNLAFAETKVFVEEYTYQASEYDSKVSCRALALEQVKRLLLEKLGTYLESETEVKNFQLTKDQIVILTAGIVAAEIVNEKWDGKTYYLKAKIAADPKDVVASINKLREDRQKTKELEETRNRANELTREVERLRKELAIAKKDQAKIARYDEAIKELSATDWFNKGLSSGISGKYQEAMEDFSKAIELDSKSTGAFVNRGVAYHHLGHYQRAIRDFDRAIELDPKLSRGYNNRGVAYGELGDHQRAIRDFDRAIELDPKDVRAYVSRGIAYRHLGDHRQAIRDYDRAIELDPKLSRGYYNRGNAYRKLGDEQKAIADLISAARLGNKNAQDYLRSQRINW